MSNLDRLSKLSNNLYIKVQNLENENKKLWSICQQIALDFAQATGRQYHDIITEHLMNFNEVSLEHSVSNETKNIYQFQNKVSY